jgi:uroporphyrinogen-III synthase
MRVWVTRSQPGAGRMADTLAQCGHVPVIAPVFSIRFLDVEVEGETSVCVVLSGHAVVAARRLRPSHGYLAIGSTTARTLAESTNLPVATPDSADSEGVVRWLSDRLAELRAAPVVILTGEGGRQVIERFLDTSKVAYRRLEVYRRQPEMLTAVPLNSDAIEIASLDALNQVHQLWSSGGGSLDIRLVVVSGRLAESARAKGFRKVTVSAGPEPRAVVEALGV